jgi:hypothetical protein
MGSQMEEASQRSHVSILTTARWSWLILRSGNTCLDGQHLFVSNLRDGVDKYVLPQMHCVQSYHHTILVNVPLQISVAQEAGRVIVGGDNGFARIFDYQTGAFQEKLDHGSGMYGSNLDV